MSLRIVDFVSHARPRGCVDHRDEATAVEHVEELRNGPQLGLVDGDPAYRLVPRESLPHALADAAQLLPVGMFGGLQVRHGLSTTSRSGTTG